MNCEICGKDPEEYVILPKRQENGSLITMACVDCSRISGMYCLKHQTPHLGFVDDTSACRDCIEEKVHSEGERIAGLFSGAVERSDKRQQIEKAINEWLELVNLSMRSASLADLPLAMLVKQTPQALNISRAIITYASRMKITPEEVIEKVSQEGAQVILPF